MSNYYYKKSSLVSARFLIRVLGILLCIAGIIGVFYTFFPLLSWQIYFNPTFTTTEVVAPIPKTTIVNSSTLPSLFTNSQQILSGVDYTNAQNWFPTVMLPKGAPQVSSYELSIPKLGIRKAIVSTNDYDLSKHLVNYPGTAIPGENGNSVIFGHSSLPQLFRPNDYTTIFATIYTLKIGDEFIAHIENLSYYYKISSIRVVDPTDTSIFEQTRDNSYLTLVTCTPPGTTWKRLIIQASLQKI